MVTIKDVAKLAGVSTATVSYVTSGNRFVSPELSERVKRAIKEFNYQPNAVAKSLKLNKTSTIGVVVSDIQDPFFSIVVKGVRDYCQKKKYGLILGDNYESPTRSQSNLDLLLEKRLDGFIIAPIGLQPKEIDSVRNSNVPFVLINRRYPHVNDPYVIVENQLASYQIVRHVIELGHRSIAIICGPRGYSTTQERLAGYQNAMEEARIQVAKKFLYFCKPDIQSARETTLELLRQRTLPTAIFATNNMITIGVLLALRERKLKIPDEMSLVCFSFAEFPWTQVIDPPLTVVNQPAYMVGWEAAKMIYSKIHNTPCDNHMVLKCSIVKRGSAAPLLKHSI